MMSDFRQQIEERVDATEELAKDPDAILARIDAEEEERERLLKEARRLRVRLQP